MTSKNNSVSTSFLWDTPSAAGLRSLRTEQLYQRQMSIANKNLDSKQTNESGLDEDYEYLMMNDNDNDNDNTNTTSQSVSQRNVPLIEGNTVMRAKRNKKKQSNKRGSNSSAHHQHRRQRSLSSLSGLRLSISAIPDTIAGELV